MANIRPSRQRPDTWVSWKDTTWECNTMRVMCCCLVWVASMPQAAAAGQVIVKNDSFLEEGCAVVQNGFRIGDIGAAVFELSPDMFPIEIITVQVHWESQSSPMQGIASIHIYGAGGPDPGPAIYTGTGAMLTPGYTAQFDATGLGWIVNQGPFAVGVEYVYDVPGNEFTSISGHLVTDSDGCQFGKNLVYDAEESKWLDACAIGMQGDFFIRLLIDSQGPGTCFSDEDLDGDVDTLNAGRFLECYTGSGNAAIPECLAFDCDGDADVDNSDYLSLETCFHGPDSSCSGGCAGCNPLGATYYETIVSAASVQATIETLGNTEGRRRTAAWSIGLIIVLILAFLLGLIAFSTCVPPLCRASFRVQWHADSVFTIDAEHPDSQENIEAAILDVLGLWATYGCQEAHDAWMWYISNPHNATNPGQIWVLVNEYTDEERKNLAAVHFVTPDGQTHQVSINKKWLTGSEYTPEVLALLLLMEWQHIKCPACSEPALQNALEPILECLQIDMMRDFGVDMRHGHIEGTARDD